MAEKYKGVYGVNREIRNEHLSRGGEKYAMYKEEMMPAIGDLADVHEHEGSVPHRMDEYGILKHTHSNESELGQELNNRYWRDPSNIEVYGVPIVPSELMKPQYDGKRDYVDYIDGIGYPSNWKKFINRLADWNADTMTLKSVASAFNANEIFDTLYNLRTYNSMILAMEPDRVGIVRHYSVAAALDGAVITNVNNHSGVDTKLGIYSSGLVARTLKRGYQFNSTRNTHYITDYLRSVYGNNAENIHNLTYILNVDDRTGKLPEIDTFDYIREISTKSNGDYESWDDYLVKTGSEDTTYDTAYNRYQNMYLHPQNLPEDYKKEHYIYDPFSPYFDLELIPGKSVDRANRLDLPLSHNTSVTTGKRGTVVSTAYYSHNEGDYESGPSQQIISDNIIDQDTYLGLDSLYHGEKEDGLLYKTEQLFTGRKIGSLVGRFHTSRDTNPDGNEGSLIQTAFTEKYGLSHGRNLLTKEAYEGDNSVVNNGYDNPYCRVWTYHHQYHRLKDAIRPFIDETGTASDVATLQEKWKKGLRTATGAKRLAENSVLNKNGLVNIAPTKGTSNATDIKRCMFSLENLAWKDVYKSYPMNSLDKILSEEQIGPNGGRIMWFPPYDLKFSENVTAQWKDEQFIGRGEPVVTYSNTTRTGQLDFTILVDHPSIVDSWRKTKGEGTEDDEQELLRFFAGCGVLDPGDIEAEDNGEMFGKSESEIESVTFNLIEDPVQTGEIVFYVFFPNNYSGYYDNATDAINYLLKGHNNSLTITSSYQGYEMNGGGITDDGFLASTQQKWGYRVDDDYSHQILNVSNYEDTKSYALNANLYNVKMIQGLGDATCSLAEFYAAVNNTSGSELNFYISHGALKENIEKLKRIFEHGEIVSMDAFGGASQHGYQGINYNQLSPRRMNTVRKWVSSAMGKRATDINPGNNIVSPVSNKDVNAIDAKGGRFAKMVIKYKAKVAQVEEVDGLNAFARNVNMRTTTLNDMRSIDTTDLSTLADAKKKVTEYRENYKAMKAEDAGKAKAQLKYDIKNGIKTAANNILTMTTGGKTGYRYDYEKEYFQNLSIKDPVMHSRLIDKVQFFDPAYHSITPEGFNARLTFLHQCTRQGHTIGATDGAWSNTAGNLAFGRPPVCVLRIGDFYHTKIIIRSLNISYDDGGIQWDTNQEGIGIQPMRAKVTMGIEFLGGSDLGAPVTRLQNAVSFNYYANTSVYDNRSDVMKYNKANGEPEYAQDQWVPTPTPIK